MGVNHGHWNRKPRKGGPRIYVFFLGYHIDRAPIHAPQKVFFVVEVLYTKVSVMIDLDKF